LVSSFSSISSRICVASSPLEVNVVSNTDEQSFRNKVVLSGRVGLNNVSSLSSDVDVEDSLKERNSSRSWSDVENVRSVLEGSSELSGVESHGHVQIILSKSGILSDRRVSFIHGPIDKARIGSVSVSAQILGGDIVSESEHAVAVVVRNAALLSSEREGPVEASLESINAVTQVVVSGPGALNANRGSNSERRDLNPLVSVGLAVNLIVLFSRVLLLVLAHVSALHVLGLSLVE